MGSLEASEEDPGCCNSIFNSRTYDRFCNVSG